LLRRLFQTIDCARSHPGERALACHAVLLRLRDEGGCSNKPVRLEVLSTLNSQLTTAGDHHDGAVGPGVSERPLCVHWLMATARATNSAGVEVLHQSARSTNGRSNSHCRTRAGKQQEMTSVRCKNQESPNSCSLVTCALMLRLQAFGCGGQRRQFVQRIDDNAASPMALER